MRAVMRQRSDPVVRTEIRIINAPYGRDSRMFWRVTNDSDVLARSFALSSRCHSLLSGKAIRFEGIEALRDEEADGVPY